MSFVSLCIHLLVQSYVVKSLNDSDSAVEVC